jgi:hypothetical protein
MLIIGDVLAIIASVLLIGASTWALVMGLALAFSRKAEASRTVMVAHPWRSLLFGALLALVPGWLSLALIALPNPGLKLAGWMALMTILAVAALGAGGLALHVSSRVRQLAPTLNPFAAFGRSVALIVTAGMVPFLGWFVIAPLTLFASLGAGFQALFEREPLTVPPPTPETA